MVFKLVSELLFVFVLLFGCFFFFGLSPVVPVLLGPLGLFYFWDQPLPNHRWSLFLIICLEWRLSPQVRTQVLCAFCLGWGFVLYFCLWGWRTDSCLFGLFEGFSNESLLVTTPVLFFYFAVLIRCYFAPKFGWESQMLPFIVGTFCSLGGFFREFQFPRSRACCLYILLLVFVLLACSSP